MQRTKALQIYDHDLKEAISEVKKDGYRNSLEELHDPVALTRIDHEIRSDFQLTRDDRLQLLGEAELAMASYHRDVIAK